MLFLALLGCTSDDAKDTGAAPPPSFTDADLVVSGEAGDMAGTSVAAADPDGDGIDGLVVGALGGRLACLVPTDGSGATNAGVCLSEAQAYDFVGTAVAAGPLGGDGRDALVLGAPGTDVMLGIDGPTASDAGAAWIVTAVPDTDASVAQAGVAWTGEAAGDAAGSFVAVAGDLDGDGRADALVGAPGSDRGGAEGGALYVVGAAPGALVDAPFVALGAGAAPSPAKHAEGILGDGVGIAACGADLDGDGLGDLAVGAPGADAGGVDAGAVGVFFGPLAPGAWALADADAVLVATRAGGYAGAALACGGDTNGDGAPELLVGADADGGGRVYVWRGGALDDGPVVTADAGEQAGYTVAFFDGGLAVGLASADDPVPDAGGVALFAGPLAAGTHALDTATARWAGVGAGDYAGVALAPYAGADGPAVAVGAPYASDVAPIAGAVYGVAVP